MTATFRTTFFDMVSRRPAWPSALTRRSCLLSLVALLYTSAESALADWNAAPETIEQHPTWIYTPSTALPDGRHPLLIVLHGCAQTHTEIKNFGNLVPRAEANGIVVAVPFVGNSSARRCRCVGTTIAPAMRRGTSTSWSNLQRR